MEISRTLSRLQARGEAMRVHFDLGLRAYDGGDADGVRRHRAAVGMLPEGGPACLAFLALHWRALWLEEQREQALEVVREAARRFPDDVDTVLELADVLHDMDADAEAAEVLMAAAGAHEDDPELWYEAGVAAERVEDWERRLASFKRVWELERDSEPPFRLWLPEERFVAVAEEAIERLPEHIREALGNVAIVVEDYPEAWIFETDVADSRILGLFDGPERAQERGVDFVATGPTRIYLFRWNIERMCGSPEEVEEQVEITVLHEIGHYLGLDEDELEMRGLG
ncbi:MAG: metallopeptidase family protein [Deltaproteobacteria bacterium]|nr:metallopeptidase family protein [Deltaproteobacteria bacterium]MCB9785957.1 metallopeptidase family protein [Deltaproteobacteria bacterium]